MSWRKLAFKMCLISNVEIIFLWWQKEGTILTDLMGEHSRWINKCLYEILSMKRGGCFSRMRISQSQTWYVCSIAYVHIQLLHKVILYVMPRISQSPKSQSLKEKKIKEISDTRVWLRIQFSPWRSFLLSRGSTKKTGEQTLCTK